MNDFCHCSRWQGGESTCSNGGNRRYRNRHHPQCSPVCQEGRKHLLSSRRSGIASSVRTRAHLEESDTQRAKVATNIEERVEAFGIVESGQGESASTDSRHDARSAEVASIGGPVTIPTCTGWRCRTDNDNTNGLSFGRPCRQEVSSGRFHHCDEEMQEWMQGRHADLQTAVGAGQLQEVARISKLLITVAQEWQELINHSTTMPSSVANVVR